MSKKEIAKTQKILNSKYVQVNISEYNSMHDFVVSVIDVLGEHDEVGSTRKDGIKYVCYSDQTCVTIESSYGCVSEIPRSITYKLKEYIVKGIGYMRERYHYEKSDFKFSQTSLILPSDSEVTYIGNIESPSLEEIQISESVQNIYQKFFFKQEGCTFDPDNPQLEEPLGKIKISLIGKNNNKIMKTPHFEIIKSNNDDIAFIHVDRLIAAKIIGSGFIIPENVNTIASYSCCQTLFDSYLSEESKTISIPSNIKTVEKFSF